MQDAYQLRFYDATTHALVAVVTDFLRLAYTRRVNAAGLVTFRLNGRHPLLANAADKMGVEVWRRHDGEWRRELAALLRDERWQGDAGGEIYDGTAVGILTMLGWRIVNWAAGTSNRSQFVSAKAETIMKTLVATNAGTAATAANGRKRDGVIAGIAIEEDGVGGNVLDWYCHGQNLLESLQKLARVGGGDFDLEKTAAGAYEFRWYGGQRGQDRTATVSFAVGLGNMGNPRYSVVRSNEATVAAVYGQGEGADRDYVTRTGANYAADNDIELFVDAKDIEKGQTAALQARGDEKLAELEARALFAFDVLQTPATRYGVHYDLGDLVTAVNPYLGATATQKITAVTVALDESGAESIKVETETP